MIFDSKNLEFRIQGISLLKIDGIIGWNLLQELDVEFPQKIVNLGIKIVGT